MSPSCPQHTPASASTAAASHLPPAYPARAPWGTAAKLRAWQAEAVAEYLRREPRDFLAVATPGAGKTTFALRVATELLDRGVISRLTVVAPTEHLKTQWADAAHRVGIRLDPAFRNAGGRTSSDYDSVALTYAQVAARPALHPARTEAAPTLVVLDEIHHGGDALSWGDAVREAFEPARRRLALTGTPFRSDTAAIPFVDYVEDGRGVRRSRADYSYGVRARSRGRRRPARAVPGVLGSDALAHQGRGRGQRQPGRGADPGHDGQRLAHCPRPGRRVGECRPGRRGPPAHRGAAGCAGRRWAGDRQ